LVCFGIQQLRFHGYRHCTPESFLQGYACGQRLAYFLEPFSSIMNIY
jgi:hypothetical protein